MSKEKFVAIVFDGRDTYAVGSDGGKGKARCHEGEVVKPEVGAVMALCRAMGVGITETCEAVAKAMGEKHKAKTKPVKVVAVPIKVGTPVGRIKRGSCVLMPLLTAAGPAFEGVRSFGKCGDFTMFYDSKGDRLCVGDLVIVSRLEGTTRTGKKWVDLPDLSIVVCEDSDLDGSKGAYIMGICDCCNPKSGKIDSRFRVRRVKTWREIEYGETYGDVAVGWKSEAGDGNG